MKLYLIRHGETDDNQQRRYVGWEDPPLTARGMAQARLLAQRLAGEQVTAVYCSDLTRAVQTALAVAAPHGLAAQPLPGLREAHFGRWSGLTYDQIDAAEPEALHAWLADPERQAPPGGESLADLRRRVETALPRENGAVVVTHGGPLRVLLSAWTGLPFWEVPVPLCSLTVLEWEGEGPPLVRCLGDIAHLSPYPWDGDRNP